MTTKVCAVISLLLVTATASALAPFGDGSDGTFSVGSAVSLGPDIDRDDSQATPAGSTSIKLIVNSGTLNPGEEILIVDTQGADAGNYEFATTLSAVGGVYTLSAPLVNQYSASTRVAKVFQYSSFGVTGGGSLSGANGLLAVRSQGAVTIAGVVEADGFGHVGANSPAGQNGEQGDSSAGPGSVSTSANGNGGGGGLTFAGGPAGGGGGGYGTVGTAGQDPTSNAAPGAGGGTVGDAQLTTIHFGGGGGGGAAALLGGPSFGGAGGGIIYLAAPSITVTGTIRSNGLVGDDGLGSVTAPVGAGGGGAGGAIFIQTGVGGFTNNGNLRAIGGLGGDGGVGTVTTGDGGNGGSGRIRVDGAISGSGSSNPAVGFNGAAVAEPAAAGSPWSVYE